MIFWNRITSYLTNPRNLRRVILITVGLLVLGAAVLFNKELEQLLNPPKPSAAYERPEESNIAWAELTDSLVKARSSGELVEVNTGGKRYIYAIGGIEHDTLQGKFELIDSVERMEISATDGSPVGVWESFTPWSRMVSGHAAFKAFQYDDYLYVVAGDVHIPDPAALASGSHPLLFSTIERLNLSNPTANWEVWAKLTGVNFYPEIATVNNNLHIIGGVYGIPFGAGNGYSWNGFNLRQPLDADEDVANWPTYRNVPTIGGVGTGLDGVSMPIGHTGTVIRSGLATVTENELETGTGATSESELSTELKAQVQIQQVQADYAKNLSDSLLSGSFATTVSEHYILNLNATGNSIKVFAGELGVDPANSFTTDYTGEPLAETWTYGKVGHLAHLRFSIGYWSTSVFISPVPQGRYGFKIIQHPNGSLMVVGGATWFSPAYYGSSNLRKTFWVIEDDLGPFPIQSGSTKIYQYVGNITYAYQWDLGNASFSHWLGSNSKGQSGTQKNGVNSRPLGVSTSLPGGYTLKDNSGISQGRAFFGLGVLETSPAIGNNSAQTTPLIVGGLINSPAWVAPANYTTRLLTLASTLRTDRLGSSGWIGEDDLSMRGVDGNSNRGIYGAHVTGLSDKAIVFDGQHEMNNGTYINDRVPDYSQSGSDAMAILRSGDQWYSMPDFGSADNEGNTQGVPGLIFSSDLDVRTTTAAGTIVYVYKAGGSTVQGDGWPLNSLTVQILGPFTYGQGGTLDMSRSYIEITANSLGTSEDSVTLRADGADMATATVHLLDYYGNPVSPAAIEEGTAITLYTTRSFHPAIKKNDKPDWIEIIGTPWNVDLWEDTYINNFVLIDRGGNEDGNDNTGVGEAQFTISSRVATDPDIGVLGYMIINNESGGRSLTDQLSGDKRIVFTAEGVPSPDASTIVADPTQVVANDTDQSTITVTLKDYNQAAISGYRVKLTSSRGDKTHFDQSVVTTNAQGVAVFKAKSATRGLATISAKCGLTDEAVNGDHAIVLSSTATVEFTGKITSLIPDNALQGQTGFDVAAVGAGTNWTPGTPPQGTAVTFIPPSVINFSWQEGDIEQLHFPANGRAVVNLALTTQANKQVTLNIVRGGGIFVGSGTGLTVTTDAAGLAKFSYRAGSVAGFVEISAQIVGGISDQLVLTSDEASAHPYDITVYVDSTNVVDNTPQRVRAIVRSFGDVVTDATDIQFDSDDEGTFSAINYDEETGIAEALYTKDSATGRAHIFAYTTYNESFIADRVLINKGGGSGITYSAITVTDRTHLTVTNVSVDENAPVGVWTFSAVSPAGDGSTAPEVVEYPFIVDPYDPAAGPHIVSISPAVGLRGQTTAVTITGALTHFSKNYSVINFEPPTSAGRATDITTVITSATATKIVANVSVAEGAEAGLWDVSVTTSGGGFSEVASKPGDGDFRVQDESGYVLDVRCDAPNNIIPRDGSAQTAITIFLGRIEDPLTGRVVPVTSHVDVELTKGADAGTLTPINKSGKVIVTTDDNGRASALYKTDSGTENAFVTITAVATPVEGTTVSNFVKILKSVSVYEGFKVWATTDPATDPPTLPLSGEPHVATLHFTGLPAGSQAVFELIGSPKGHITNNNTTSVAYYEADADRISESVEFWAQATIPGIGMVRSNTAILDVGLNQSQYRLTMLAPNPATVQAGGGTSTITAQLKFNGQNVNGWPIDFEVTNGSFGDYVTKRSVNTSNGNAVTTFVAGPVAGNIVIRARARGLALARDVVVSKTTGQEVDPLRSSIWAAPTHIPVDSTGAKYSVVTVLLKNDQDIPLKDISVKLSSNRSSQDAIKKGDGTTGDTVATDSTGRARFRVSSSTAGTSTISATASSQTLSTSVVFESSGLIAQYLKVIVPFEARDYDNEVLTYVKKDGSTSDADVFVSGYYTKSARPNNELTELNSQVVYLRPNTTYRIWVKGRYHLARAMTFITGSSNMINANSPIEIKFTELLIGDLAPSFRVVGGSNVLLPFHDNAVNTVDLAPIYDAWFDNADAPDFLRDFVVNAADWLFWFNNYGNGELGGPPPYDKRL